MIFFFKSSLINMLFLYIFFEIRIQRYNLKCYYSWFIFFILEKYSKDDFCIQFEDDKIPGFLNPWSSGTCLLPPKNLLIRDCLYELLSEDIRLPHNCSKTIFFTIRTMETISRLYWQLKIKNKLCPRSIRKN